MRMSPRHDDLAYLSSASTFDLNVLLGVIPGSSGVGHHNSKHHTRSNGSSKTTGQALRSNQETNSERRKNSIKTWKNHFFDGRLSGNSNALVGISLCSSFAESRNLGELTADLNDNSTSHLRRGKECTLVRVLVGHDRILARHEEDGRLMAVVAPHTHHFAYAREDNLRTKNARKRYLELSS